LIFDTATSAPIKQTRSPLQLSSNFILSSIFFKWQTVFQKNLHLSYKNKTLIQNPPFFTCILDFLFFSYSFLSISHHRSSFSGRFKKKFRDKQRLNEWFSQFDGCDRELTLQIMWSSFWRSRDRFSLDELRFLSLNFHSFFFLFH